MRNHGGYHGSSTGKTTGAGCAPRQLAELTAQLATLDAEIDTLYSHDNGFVQPNEFILQARIDCSPLSKNLGGKQLLILQSLLATPEGVMDYDQMITTAWKQRIPLPETIRSTFSILSSRIYRHTKLYVIHAYMHGNVWLAARD